VSDQLPSSDVGARGVPAELPIWKGRRGFINTVLCCVLSLPCALGLWFFAERSTIVPACTAYAAAHGMSYTDFKLVGVRHASTVVCLLTQANGGTQDVHLGDVVSFFTDFWVGFAMSLEFTVPGFAILLALARVGWYRHTARVAS
jgi:hypothetical protein